MREQQMKINMKLHLGCGNDIRIGYINLDMVALNGVDVTHDLSRFPYPFDDNTFDEIVAIDVIEHLPNTIKVMEELYRICQNGAKVIINVPYWNHRVAYGDVTHARVFDFSSFDYLDASTRQGQKRAYYSSAQFKVESVNYLLSFSFFTLAVGFRMQHSKWGRFIKEIFKYVSNTISTLEFHLICIK
jgi:SAM-dependent methyltransferase